MTSNMSLADYGDSLAQTFRLRGMQEEEIETIVGDVLSSNVADPISEFGTTEQYASQFAVDQPVARGGGLWWWAAGAALAWAIVAITLLVTRVWTTPVPVVLVGLPMLLLIGIGGVFSAFATAKKRPWQKH